MRFFAEAFGRASRAVCPGRLLSAPATPLTPHAPRGDPKGPKPCLLGSPRVAGTPQARGLGAAGS